VRRIAETVAELLEDSKSVERLIVFDVCTRLYHTFVSYFVWVCLFFTGLLLLRSMETCALSMIGSRQPITLRKNYNTMQSGLAKLFIAIA